MQEWQTKARSEGTSAQEDTKKRKREDNDNENDDKAQTKSAKKAADSRTGADNEETVLSENTSSKLAGFAFGKN